MHCVSSSGVTGDMVDASTMSDDQPVDQSDASTASAGSDLVPRILSGIVMIAGALAALYFGGIVWALVIVICAALMCFEWQQMTIDGAASALIGLSLAAAVCACLFVFWFFGPIYGMILTVALSVTAALFHLLDAANRWLWAALGVLYVCIPAASLIWLRGQNDPDGLILVAFLLLAVWATDIGAYAVGRTVGGPKIFPSISPKKTWSGSIGGAAIAAASVMLLKPSLGLEGSYVSLAMAGIVMSIVCQMGDAFESAVKRNFDVKDSGNLIPGHGGILDRLDGLLFCAPVLALVIWISMI